MIHAPARRLMLLAVPLTTLALTTAGLAAVAAASVVNGTTINDHGTQDVSSATSVSMQMGDMFFAPSTLKGRPGQRITIHLTNTGQASHTFTLAAQNIDQLVAPGGSASVTVTFPMSGSAVWMCKFHTAMGMNGALQVAATPTSASPTPASATPAPTRTATTTTTTTTTTGTGSSTSSGSSMGAAQSSTTASTSGSAGLGTTMPVGGVSTGAGGTAGKTNLALLVAGSAVAVAGAALLTGRRRTFGHRS